MVILVTLLSFRVLFLSLGEKIAQLIRIIIISGL